MNRCPHIDTTLTLPLRYFGSVEYYAAMGACARVIVNDTARYDKRRKETHRMTVIDTHGVKTLTVPVTKPDDITGPLHWSDISISRHGRWWHVIAETLASAYGRTPFFEFYIDRLTRFFRADTPDNFNSVATLCREADTAVRRILGFNNDVIYASQLDASDLINRNGTPLITTRPIEYYQVRSDKFGFVPSLSILDLIFNMGPESPVILSEMAHS